MEKDVLRFLGQYPAFAKAIIVGMEPYPSSFEKNGAIAPEATGRSFEVASLKRWTDRFKQASLRNILKAIYRMETGETVSMEKLREEITSRRFPVSAPKQWFDNLEDQGVIFLNATLTVKQHEVDTHTKEWESFMDCLIQYVGSVNQDVIWCLIGTKAKNRFLPKIGGADAIITCHPRLGAFVDTDLFRILGGQDPFCRMRKSPGTPTHKKQGRGYSRAGGMNMIHGELIIDNFAGGGGASTGIRLATGVSPDIAVDRDLEDVRLHAANHPGTRHICADIWQVDPTAVCGDRSVGLAWFSPDCTHFSKARGNRPRDKAVRGLAWSVCRWAALVRPRVIIVENVPGFRDWGPLGRKGRPVRKKKGQTFRKFVAQLEGIGYRMEYRELSAADYGAPTTRRRFFLVARMDGKPVAWPERTHGPAQDYAAGDAPLPYEAACMGIDFTDYGQSILWEAGGHRVMRQTAEKTLWRYREGMRKFIAENPDPFLIYGTGHDGQCVDVAFIIQQQGQSVGSDIRLPLNTITAGGMGHMYLAVVRLNAPGEGGAASAGTEGIGEAGGIPGTIAVHGRLYHVVQAWLRILKPEELYACQGVPKGYVIDRGLDGNPISGAEQARRCGNSVCPPVAAALVRANLPEMCRMNTPLGMAAS